MQTNMHEAKSKLSYLVDLATAGEQVIIAKAGVPCVQLTPYVAPARRVFGQFKGKVSMNADFDSNQTNQDITDMFEQSV
ncbi:MAG: type II toxin-antitoxin system Phd/YefM family antitoxin [Saccharospirillaceae bacterium]|nr:type II toxin-antitoxin system Phd/YefM family antitoxin [Pseudomonadales bacterium]NRB80879.1 type II toxin-antitoxin system Phd/YefM family antitoxin [Saccharospirillaceae bacterium]